MMTIPNKLVKIEATKFVKNQIDKDITKVLSKIIKDAEIVFNSYPKDIKNGLYPFSKIVSIFNLYKLRCPLVKITSRNKKFLQHDFVARKKGELEYLRRWFPKKSPVKGMYGEKIDVILYSKKQLEKERSPIKSDWGVVAINVEMRKSSPVPPMTMINNQLGIKFGGNGEKINWKEYKKSVEFWKQYAIKQR